ncbi:MAG TPA: hypothetical protein VFA68_07470 [Terriglobales bacterium]|nr:hypothetical protein [Terriglobales bacterium]
MQEESKLDAKLASELLVTSNIDEMWEYLWKAVQATCEKIQLGWQIDLTPKLADESEVIWVTAPRQLADDQFHQFIPKLEIRLDRTKKQVRAKLVHRSGSEIHYPIKADLQNNKPVFERSGTQCTPLALAEHLIAERLLRMSLD